MLDSMAFVVFLIIAALAFDFLNGFHDSANSISTVVSTRVLSPQYAVIWAAFFNFAAVFFVGTAVAHTVGKGIIHLNIVDNLVILSALSGAIIWNITTWYWMNIPPIYAAYYNGTVFIQGVKSGSAPP